MIEVSLAALAAAEVTHGADETGHAALAWWQDPAIWVSLAFVVVAGMLWRLGAFRNAALMLDKRSQKIADELAEAQRLRGEAEALLAQYQTRQREAEAEAKVIVEEARREAARLGAEMRQKIADQIDRRARAAEDKIARAETQALAEVRGQAADLAIEAARMIIRSRIDQGGHAALVDKSISELRAKIN